MWRIAASEQPGPARRRDGGSARAESAPRRGRRRPRRTDASGQQTAFRSGYRSPLAPGISAQKQAGQRDEPTGLTGSGGRFSAQQPEHHGQEGSQTQDQADDQQHQHLWIAAEEFPNVLHCWRCAAPTAHRDVKRNRRRPTLPGPCEPSTIGAEGLNCSVRNGKRCFPLAIATGNWWRPPLGGPSKLHSANARASGINHPSSPRPISTGLLHTSPCFQIRPINLVIFQGSYSLKGMGELISYAVFCLKKKTR